MSQKATVGRIVHFYNSNIEQGANNGMGHGPYPAIVTQVFSGGEYANLKVLPYGAPWDEGSVREGSNNPDVPSDARHWVWPPKDAS